MRCIKNYKKKNKKKKKLKQELLITNLKSEQSFAELYKSKSNNAKIEETKKDFNELRDKFSKSEIKEITKKLYENEKFEEYFKELEKKNYKWGKKG